MSSKNVNNKKLYTFLRLYFGFSVRSLCVYFLQHCFPQDPRKYSNLTALINCFKRRRIFQSWEKQTLRLLYVDLCRKLNMICGNGEEEPLKATFGNFTDFHSAHFAVMKFLLMLKSIFNGKSNNFPLWTIFLYGVPCLLLMEYFYVMFQDIVVHDNDSGLGLCRLSKV